MSEGVDERDVADDEVAAASGESAFVERRLDGRLDDRAFDHLVAYEAGRSDDEASDPNIELLAEPVRYPLSPLVALIAIAIVPAVALLLTLRWSAAQADEYEADRADAALWEDRLEGAVDIGGSTPTTDGEPSDVAVEPAPSLATAVFDYRRTPGAVTAVARAERLKQSIDPVLAFLGDQACSAVAVDGTLVTGTNTTKPIVPASNQKLLVATAALEVLGPEFTFSTSIAVPNAVDGVVEGDIYLIGGGDPVLESTDFDESPDDGSTSLDVLADALVEAGITRINGTVIGDGTRYDDEFVVGEWAPGIALVEAGPYDALLANDGRVRGQSSIPDDPNAGAAREFVRLLNERDIRVNNGFGSGVASTLVPILATVESAPLSDIIGQMLLVSDNNTAEMLLKELGFATSDLGTRAAGLDAMAAALTDLGVPMEGVVSSDGSGLSANNRVTCSALLKVVQLGAGGPLDTGLPVAAVSGTLATEFVDTAMAGRLRAKTGTLTNVKALAGYVDPVEGSDAGTIEFVVISNLPGVSAPNVYQQLWGAVGDRLATYPQGPDSNSLSPR